MSGSTFAKKRFGQNFLVDGDAVRRIADAACVDASSSVLEIGPGRGALTRELLERGASVTAIEIDRDLQQSLEDSFAATGKFRLIRGDVLSDDLEITGESPIVVGNLPYNISTAILQRLIVERSKFGSLVLMFQREVADRIVAEAGNGERGFLSVIAQAAFEIERCFDLPPSAFRPSPKVRSTVLRFTPKPAGETDDEEFRRFLSVAFSQPRKMLRNNIRHEIPENVAPEIDLTRRAASLELSEWVDLYSQIKKRPD